MLSVLIGQSCGGFEKLAAKMVEDGIKWLKKV